MKKVLATLAIVGLTVGLTATAAGAHTHVVSATCEGLTVALAKYQGTNTLTVTLDGVTTSETFGAVLAVNKVTDKTVAHTWTVTVDSSDNVGEFTESGTIAACVVPPTTTAPPTTTTRPSTPPVSPPAPPRVVVAPPRTTG